MGLEFRSKTGNRDVNLRDVDKGIVFTVKGLNEVMEGRIRGECKDRK